jgi:hypothetical protein
MTTTEPATHYTPYPAGSLAGDTLVACGTAHWGIVSGDLAQVTCEPCKVAAPGFQHLAAALAARAKTSVSNPLRPHVGALGAAVAAALAYHPQPAVSATFGTSTDQVVAKFRHELLDVAAVAMLIYRNVPEPAGVEP